MGRIDYLIHKMQPPSIPLVTYPTEPERYWQGRFWSQMNFLWDVSGYNGNRFDAELETVLEQAYREFLEEGSILTKRPA